MEKPHKRLEVWKTSMEMVFDLYEVTNRFSTEEKLGLIS